jgi:hypothetical protein
MLNTHWPAQEAKMPGIVEFFFVLFVALRDELLVNSSHYSNAKFIKKSRLKNASFVCYDHSIS